jgi:tetratricopeptide (TPR) repeat protein
MNWEDHLTVAEGLLEIGLPLDASEEIEKIEPADKARSVVYVLRLQVYLALKRWDLAEACAKHLTKVSPDAPGWRIAWAVCVRETAGPEASESILQDALSLFPKDSATIYHVACLAAVQGDLIRAKVLLATAIGYDDSLKARALDDEDLRSVWDEIEIWGERNVLNCWANRLAQEFRRALPGPSS